MSMFKPEVQAKDIEFNFCPHRSLHELNVDWVNLDPSRLLQITVNLITNAIKFTQASSKRVISVHLGASVDQPELHVGGFDYIPIRTSVFNATAGSDWGEGQLLYIRVKVEDTGCGLTVDEKKVLFGRFAQASPRTHAHYGGSGLGLFISRQLAELHGGQIGVSSEAGVGSTFGFFIQARRTSAVNSPALLGSVLPGSSQPVKSMRDENTKRAGPATSPSRTVPIPIATTNQSPIDPSDLHILIVEDNLVNQRVLSKQLRKAGSIVYTADNGLLALEHLATTSFQVSTGTKLSVILMDLEMPEMDGLTCVGRIREMEDEGTMTGHVPVIAVTANVREEQVATAISNGMDDVLKKPFRVPELLEKIGVVLERLGRR
jgi:CheY-like chemotaxis protein